ncbi:hypothetical protein ACHAW6_006953 [Cyclotella cf. meneghiniana]
MGSLFLLYGQIGRVVHQPSGDLGSLEWGTEKSMDGGARALAKPPMTTGTEAAALSVEVLALLKPICNCIVFSNNPRKNLLKFRGKKNHEGLYCCCGLISVGMGLFGNFPNA